MLRYLPARPLQAEEFGEEFQRCLSPASDPPRRAAAADDEMGSACTPLGALLPTAPAQPDRVQRMPNARWLPHWTLNARYSVERSSVSPGVLARWRPRQ